jgi:aromatic-L-amino-acid/L-tryptophan decarboxylase
VSASSPRRLAMTSAELREAIRVVGEAMVTWQERLPGLSPAGAAHDPHTGGVRPGWMPPAPAPLPETGEDLARLVEHVIQDLAPDAQVVGHPRFFGYVAGAGNPVSSLAQALAMTINPYTGTFTTAPALVRLEDDVVRWFASIVGYPDDAAGFLTTGSSLAVLSAVIAARERKRAPWDRARIYAGDQTHHCLGKALFAAGYRPENLVVLASPDYRLDPAQLTAAIAADRARGLVPVLVVASAGTTNTGRVDPLDAIADVCAESGAWFHCDAAYGGFFRLLPEAGPLLRGMEQADSISLDPHKSLAMPYGTGALLARRVADLRFPRGLADSYMPPLDDADLRYEYAEIGPELSRDFRGLRVWLALRHFGLAPFRENLREKWRLARRLAAELTTVPTLEVVTEPELTVLTLRMRDDVDDARTRALLARVNASGRGFLTTCRLEGRLVIRVCLLGFRVDDASVDELLAVLREESAAVAAGS